jgi:hypothetical protein
VSRGVIDPNADNTDVLGSNWSDQTTVFITGERGTPGQRNDGFVGAPPSILRATTTARAVRANAIRARGAATSQR